MNKDQYIHAIKVAILREEKEFQGVILPSPQRTGTGLQQNTYAKMEAEKIYDKHFKNKLSVDDLKAKHEKLRNILISYGCEEHGDCIIDEISILFGVEPTTVYYEE